MNKLETILKKIDEANSQDPNTELENGQPVAKELLYSKRMTRTLNDVAPDASEHLQIAARAQHIERWKSLRSDYPQGRAGYKKWRAELGLYHANRTAILMKETLYSQDDIDRVKYLIQKRGLKKDSETQMLEDVICLVFLQYYFDSFAAKHNEEKVIDIVQKTWKKMSEFGHAHALKLSFSDANFNLVKSAIS